MSDGDGVIPLICLAVASVVPGAINYHLSRCASTECVMLYDYNYSH